MQRILYRSASAQALGELLQGAARELPVGVAAEPVSAGDWVLAVFDVERPPGDTPKPAVGAAFWQQDSFDCGERAPVSERSPCSEDGRRPTCVPARVVEGADGELRLRFAEADWKRVHGYAKGRANPLYGRAAASVRSPQLSEPVPSRRATGERIAPSEFPSEPLPPTEKLCILHVVEPGVGCPTAEALGQAVQHFSQLLHAEAYALGKRVDAVLVAIPLDESVVEFVKRFRLTQARAAVVCLAQGTPAGLLRGLFAAGVDEVLQGQTLPAEVAATLLAMVRRRAGRDALGAA